jgi:succinoglycan biosynthesis protein ExoM
MKDGIVHISVCVCTYKRPNHLAKLLDEVGRQRTDGSFRYSVVVVDNDAARSAEKVVQTFRQSFGLDVIYAVEPIQNIALARNMAVENATGDFIAFLDDDEFPAPDWLLNLLRAFQKHPSDGILGPVHPYFEQAPPRWLVRGKFCERKSHKTGSVLHWSDTRTGNVLFHSRIFKSGESRFDQKFGRSGGEDGVFFEKAIKEGKTFIWCQEAPVYETVLSERYTKAFYFKKAIRMGGLTGELEKSCSDRFSLLGKAVLGFIYYSACLPLSFLPGLSILKCIIQICYHFAYITGFLGWVFIRNR